MKKKNYISKIGSLLLMMLLGVSFVNSQENTLVFSFSVVNLPGNNTLTQNLTFVPTSSGQGNTNPWHETITFDLRPYGICEGQTIDFRNNSHGWVSYGTPANNVVSSTTGWDLAFGGIANQQWHTSGYVLGGPSNNDGDTWSPNPLPVTLQNGSAVSGTTTVSMVTAPELNSQFRGIFNTSTNCSNGLIILFLVNAAPNCIANQIACQGDVLSSNLIPSGVTASNWSPYDPTLTPVTQTTNFSVTLTNGSGAGCPTNCSFTVTVPTSPFVTGLAPFNCLTSSAQLPLVGNNFYDMPNFGNIRYVYINGVLALDYLNDYFNPAYFDSDYFFKIPNSGTYTIQTVFITGTSDEITCTSTQQIVVTAAPTINLASVYQVCGNQFPTLCVPSGTFQIPYKISWKFRPVGGTTFSNVSLQACFTPTAYGDYTVTVQSAPGCSSTHTFSVVPGVGPALNLQDITYCGKSPINLSVKGLVSEDAASYSWTFNGNPLGYTGPEVENKGDGTYCVTVLWKSGCTSTDCFEVFECCEPKTEFQFTWTPSTSTGTITVQNLPGNSQWYTSESWTLERKCGNGQWQGVQNISRSSNFNDPVVFSGLSKNCQYRVIHRVYSACINKSFVSTYSFAPFQLKIYGNPLKNGEALNIEMISESERAVVEINDVMTGKPVYTGTLEHGAPLKIDYSTFERGGRAGMRDYTIKISNSSETATERLIVN